MNFYERYKNEPIEELVQIIEDPTNYVEECVKSVVQIIKEGNWELRELKSIAYNFHKEKVRETLKTFSALNDQVEIPKSTFLDKDEMKNLYLEQVKWLQDRDDLFKVESYI